MVSLGLCTIQEAARQAEAGAAASARANGAPYALSAPDAAKPSSGTGGKARVLVIKAKDKATPAAARRAVAAMAPGSLSSLLVDISGDRHRLQLAQTKHCSVCGQSVALRDFVQNAVPRGPCREFQF